LEEQSIPNKWQNIVNILTALLTFVLWLGTSIYGLVIIYFTRQTAVRVYNAFALDPIAGDLIGSAVLFIMGIAWLGYVIGTGEYHMKHVREPGSWAIIATGIGVELMLLIVYFAV
jgi:hypothetical protein